jgi:hypothetical protein
MYGITGTSEYNTGVYGWSYYNEGAGVVGVSGANGDPYVTAGVVGSGSGSGVYGGYFASTNSSGVIALSGTSTVPNAVAGVVAVGNTVDGVYGTAGAGAVGVFGVNTASGGTGVQGNASGGGSSGVFGDNTSGNGYGVYGVSSTGIGGNFSSGTGYGVYADTGGNTPAVFASNTYNSGGQGVLAQASGNGSVGVLGENLSGNGYGVQGITGTGFGIYGLASGTGAGGEFWSQGGGYGIYAKSTGGTAGYFAGSVTITGSLTVTGEVNGGNGGSCTCTSDERLKKNIQPLKGALDQLARLRPVTFEWKDPEGGGHPKDTGTIDGFIAQEIEKDHPGWVNKEGYTDKDGQKYRTLDLRQIEALEVQSIQDLKGQLDAERARGDKAQKDMEELRTRFNLANLPNAGYHFPSGAPWAVAGALGCYVWMTRRKKAAKQA